MNQSSKEKYLKKIERKSSYRFGFSLIFILRMISFIKFSLTFAQPYNYMRIGTVPIFPSIISRLLHPFDSLVNVMAPGPGFLLASIPHILLWGTLVGFLMEHRNKRKRKYIAILENQQVYSVNQIATIVSKPVSRVQKELQEIIEAKVFEGISIDYENSLIVFASKKTGKIVACPSCGAQNEVFTDENTKCEYCGTPLK